MMLKCSFARALALVALASLALAAGVSAEGTKVKVCCVGDEEYDACVQMVDAFFGGVAAEDSGDDDGKRRRSLLQAPALEWQCVKIGAGDDAGGDDDGKRRRRSLLAQGSVMEMIANGECNLGMDMDAHDVYDANKDFAFEALAAEDYTGDGLGLTYYGVAVVPASTCELSPGLTLSDMAGAKSCHTGYRRTSGWTIPMGTIADLQIQANGVAAVDGKTDIEVMQAFFPEMCAPGGPDENSEAMCANCVGDCKRGPTEPYSGYAGSLRCLMEGGGSVAFMKETTALDFASDGTAPQDWSTLRKADLKLLCPQGGCMDVEDFDSCNYARIPSHMVAASSEELPLDQVRAQLMEAAATPAFAQWLATAPALFKSGTVGLVPVQQDTVEYLGKLVNVYKVLEDLGFY